MNRFLGVLLLWAVAARAEPGRPEISDLAKAVGDIPGLIKRVAVVSTLANNPRGITPPADLVLPAGVTATPPADLLQSIAINDVSHLASRADWARFVTHATKAGLVIETDGQPGKAWKATMPDGKTHDCPVPAGGASRWTECLGYQGVVAVVTDVWYLAYSYREGIVKGKQAIIVEGSESADLLSGKTVVGDGFLTVVDVAPPYVLLKALVRSSTPVVPGLKVIFESSN